MKARDFLPFPEGDINRLLTDSISDFLFCTEQSGVDNLICEGIPKEKIFLVGNVMIDTLLDNKAKAKKSNILDKLNLNGDDFAPLTLHRPANVDNHRRNRLESGCWHQPG
ncbi:hypothetical protein E3J49_05530 [Candidatus Bathyarchaeota archaeon]|nr:MAG: hypothetical protein E3J49_05530 [Candidatus Bathyarchaeota archaeon]